MARLPGLGPRLRGWDLRFGQGAAQCLLGPRLPAHTQTPMWSFPQRTAKDTEFQRVEGLVQGHTGGCSRQASSLLIHYARARGAAGPTEGQPQPLGGLWCRSPGTRSGVRLHTAPKCWIPSRTQAARRLLPSPLHGGPRVEEEEALVPHLPVPSHARGCS